ncbi:MAG: peptidyl-prolyl cis-trans isomerase [Xanthomonadales bacterium]|jgi:peptidyl-prolyl cis-trans isomerase C|nr:peptidyl-prolyl cis-trans isomerase [Xanthomonadales bacterium]
MTHRSFARTGLVTALALALAACGQGPTNAQPPEVAQSGVIQVRGGSPAFKVNGEVVPQPLVDAYAKRRGFDLNDPGQAQQIKKEVANLVAMAQEARKRRVDQTPEAELERLNVLSGQLLSTAVESTPISDDELKAKYDEQVAAAGTLEYKLDHILYRNEEAAKAAIAELDGGKAFEAVMSEAQTDTNVAQAQTFDFIQPTVLPPTLAEAVRALAVGGRAAAPVQTEYGFHVFRIAETRPFSAPDFDTVKDGIRQQIQQERRAAFLKGIEDATRIE